MNNFICSKCRQLMKCTSVGRLIVFNKSTGGHGDEYSCPECGTSVVFTNSKQFDISKTLGRIRDETSIEIERNGKSWGLSPEAVAIDRDLNSLDEKQLRAILSGEDNSSTTPSLSFNFTEAEIVQLIAHPQFDSFSPGFKELIWSSVSEIFARELKKPSTN